MKSFYLLGGIVAPFCSGFAPNLARFGLDHRHAVKGSQWSVEQSRRQAVMLYMANQVGIFFGTSTGSTEDVAYKIAEAFGKDVADGPFDVEEFKGKLAEEFGKYQALIVGTPTWNTGADTERSGVAWDEVYYGEMQDLNLQGKKVGVFGLGDSISYAENYADATGELHDVLQNLGCRMMGYTSQEGYEHEDSKSIRGDKFCGLLCDAVNQEELTDERVQNWVQQLLEEGILEGGDAAAPAMIVETAAPKVQVVQETAPAPVPVMAMNQPVNGVTESINQGFTPFYNSKTGSTMWVSQDGRSCYYS